ncbi:MAG: phosphatase PAP2 family protein [Methylococcaceae bacterium]
MNNNPLLTLSPQWRELSIVLLLILISTPLFWLTNLDQYISSWFFNTDNGGSWLGQQLAWCRWLFNYAPRIIVSIAVLALIIAILSYWQTQLKPLRRPCAYFVLLMLLGPGLIVNVIFKDHWGRPRPVHISQFNGKYDYIPPLKLGHTEDKSFSCGHCAAVFSLFALYFLARRNKRYYLLLALSLGAIMGFVRLSAGGHFLSDILWSGYIVFISAWLLYYYWYTRES